MTVTVARRTRCSGVLRVKRFLMLEPTQSVEPPSLTIITNWTNLLKK